MMTDQSGDLFETIETVQETTITANQLKNAALLRNLTHYCAQLYNRTTRSGKCAVLSLFCEIRDELMDV